MSIALVPAAEDERASHDILGAIRRLEVEIERLLYCETLDDLRARAELMQPKIDVLVSSARAKKQILLAWRAYDLHATLGDHLGKYFSEDDGLHFRSQILCDLDQQSSYRRNYNLHPVQAFELARSWPAAAHVGDQELSAMISGLHYFGAWGRRGCESPRVSGGALFYKINYRHGLYCVSCQSSNCRDFDGRVESDYLPAQWTVYGLCDDCVLANKTRRFLAAEKEQIAEKRFRAAVAEKRRLRNEERARKDADFAARRDAARIARERGKIEREAAYQFVKDLGMFDRVKQRMEEGNEAGKTD